jgi:Secretion system C-terminal sorting domain
MKITKILNTPHGIHLYRVNEMPYSTDGLELSPNYYFGVFSADNAIEAKYTVTYTYTYGNGITTVGNESNSTLYKKSDGSELTWMLQPSSLLIASKKLTKKNFEGRSEFIYNITSPNGAKVIAVTENNLKVYPQPANQIINVDNVEIGANLQLINLNGEVVKVIYDSQTTSVELNIQDLVSGVYFVRKTLGQKVDVAKIVVQH